MTSSPLDTADQYLVERRWDQAHLVPFESGGKNFREAFYPELLLSQYYYHLREYFHDDIPDLPVLVRTVQPSVDRDLLQ